MASQRVGERYRGSAGAESPTDIPKDGWLRILKRSWAEARKDQVPLLAAGVAFYSFLALFPAMIAAVLLYGLVADPETITEQAGQVASALPQNAGSLVVTQMRTLAKAPEQSLSLGLLISLVLALWSASGGVGNVITALNLAYDEKETRSFVKRKALALGLTLGEIVFVVLAIALVAAVPAILDALVPAGPLYWLLEGLRWVLLVAIVACVLAVLYHVAPDRDAPKFRWMSFGAVVATIIWIVASVGFSVYVNTFGSYGKTYGGGAVTSVVVLLLWLWITNVIVLFGAEINAEAETATAGSG